MKNALALSALLLATAAATPVAWARDVAGVNVAETVSAEGKTLKLNGAGIRKKFIIKVYVGALYLEETSTNAGEIVKSDQVKQLKDLELENTRLKRLVADLSLDKLILKMAAKFTF